MAIKIKKITCILIIVALITAAVVCFTPYTVISHAATIADLPDNVITQWYDGADYLNYAGALASVSSMFAEMSEADKSARRSDPVVIAVIDTGINLSHEIFEGLLYQNAAETAGNAIDDDGNGYKDDICGWDFINRDAEPLDDCTAPHSHGTHVSGIIAREIAKYGLKDYVRILPLKAGTVGGNFNDAKVISAINYAINIGADVINMSFCGRMSGDWGKSSALYTTIKEAHAQGIVMVAAAGNDRISSDSLLYSPAGFEEVIGVMAYEEAAGGGAMWVKSLDIGTNMGSKYDVIAPGANMYSAVRDDYRSLNGDYINDNGDVYALKSGTSMASPIVSFMAAVLMIKFDMDSDKTTYTIRNCASSSVASYKKVSLVAYLDYNPVSSLAVQISSGDATQSVVQTSKVQFVADIQYYDTTWAVDGDNIFDDLNWYIEKTDSLGTVTNLDIDNNSGRTFAFTPSGAGIYNIYVKLGNYQNFKSTPVSIDVNYSDISDVTLSISGDTKGRAENEYLYTITNFQYIDPYLNTVIWQVYLDDKLIKIDNRSGDKFVFSPTEAGNYRIVCTVNDENDYSVDVKIGISAAEAGTICGAVTAAAVFAASLGIIIAFFVKRFLKK